VQITIDKTPSLRTYIENKTPLVLKNFAPVKPIRGGPPSPSGIETPPVFYPPLSGIETQHANPHGRRF